MNPSAFFIKEIFQKDNYTFTIVWNDGLSHDYRLSHLQKKCPCAGCQEGVKAELKAVKEDVKAQRIFSVGRYALRIEFTSGCSAGIYGYDLLRAQTSAPSRLTPHTQS